MNSTNSSDFEIILDSQSYGQDYELLNFVTSLINSFIPITFTLIGLIGNILSFVVYSRACFKDTSTGFYLRVMAVTDSITLIDWAELYKFNFGIDLRSHYSVACKMAIYISLIPYQLYQPGFCASHRWTA